MDLELKSRSTPTTNFSGINEIESLFERNWSGGVSPDIQHNQGLVDSFNDKYTNDLRSNDSSHHEEPTRCVNNLVSTVSSSQSEHLPELITSPQVDDHDGSVITIQPTILPLLDPEPVPPPQVKPVSRSWFALWTVLTCSGLGCCRESEESRDGPTTSCSPCYCADEGISSCCSVICDCLSGVGECFQGCCECFSAGLASCSECGGCSDCAGCNI